MKKILAGICALIFVFSSSAFALTGYVSVVKKIKETKETKKHCFKHIKKRKIIIDYKYETMDDKTAVVKSASDEVLFKFKDKSIFDSCDKEIANYDECFIYEKTGSAMIMLNSSEEIFETRNVGDKYESFKKGKICEGSTTQLSAIYKKKSKICQFNKCIPKVVAMFISFLEDLNSVDTTNLSNIVF